MEDKKSYQKNQKMKSCSNGFKTSPDKWKAAGEPIKKGDKDYFTCITKAYEMLSDPCLKGIPDGQINRKKKVPKLGVMNSSLEDIDAFHSFGYNFDSWREFSYLNEEEKEKAECHDERRWIEKQNRATRAEREKKEMNRIRTLVDNAEEEKPRKKQKRKAKQKQNGRSEKLKKNKDKLNWKLFEKEEEEVRQQALLAKKEKDIQKKSIKKERQKLQNSHNTWNHFSDNEAEQVQMMEELEKKLQCNTFRTTGRSTYRFHPSDNRRTEAFGTSFENIPSKYTREIGTHSRNSAWQDKGWPET
ncbi:hypothetical protein GH733_010730, partial [Mirounga leonina]